MLWGGQNIGWMQDQIEYRCRIENWRILWVTSPGESSVLSQYSYIWPAELRNLHSQTCILEMLGWMYVLGIFAFLKNFFLAVLSKNFKNFKIHFFGRGGGGVKSKPDSTRLCWIMLNIFLVTIILSKIVWWISEFVCCITIDWLIKIL